jgi:crotonobetaine/carnitine-CoA ligase
MAGPPYGRPTVIERVLLLPHLVARRAAATPDRVYLQAVDGPSLTYAEVHARARAMAAGLAGLGVGAGDRVVTMLPTGPDSVVTWLACAWLRALQVPLNPDFRGRILGHAIALAGAKVAILDAAGAARVAELPDGAEAFETVVAAGDGLDALAAAGAAGTTDFDGPDGHDPACVLFTSGTTGPSKGVLVSWRQLYQQATGGPPLDALRLPVGADAPPGIDLELAWSTDHSIYSPLPHFHLAGKVMAYRAALPGGRLVLRERFATDRFWDDARATGATESVLLGAMAQFLFQQPPRDDDATGPLKTIQMPPLIPEARAFAERFGVRLWTCYASTECSTPIETGYDWTDWRSCGQRNPGYTLRLVDAHDHDVPEGAVGELVVRTTDPWLLNLGYLDNPAATAAAWRNGWLHTGDAFRRDAEGNYFFVDRLKDAIRRRGENISSLELEAEVAEHPAVAECAAVGVPSSFGEEDVLVAVVPAPGAPLDPAELVAFLQPRIPRFMLPRYVRVVAELPKTPTAKVRKGALRDAGVPAGTFDREALDRPTSAAGARAVPGAPLA